MAKRPSSIRRKTNTLFLFTTLALTGVVALASVFILLSSYTRLETRMIQDNLETASATLAYRTACISQVAVYWAAQADVAAFLRDPETTASPAFERGPSICSGVDQLVLLSPQGTLLAQQALDAASPLPAAAGDWSAYFRAHAPLSTGRAGLAALNGRVWLVAVQPAEGGSVLAAQLLDAEEMGRLADIVQRGPAIYSLADPALPQDVRKASDEASASRQDVIQSFGGNQVAGYRLLDDLWGDPAAVLRLVEERGIFTQGRISIGLFTLAALAAGYLFALVISRNLDREVISRLEELYQGIRRIREKEDFSASIQLRGDDELTRLAGGINETFRALKDNRERLVHEAMHDALTGFPNRAFFTQTLNQALALLETGRVQQVALLYVDLDGFKLINDSYDHQFGDRILIAFGERLKACLRADDFVARLGGDEFAVLLESVHAAKEAERVAVRLLEDTRRPFEMDGRSLFLTCSIGIATTAQAIRGEELLRNADMAMYSAKDEGKAGYAIFDENMHNLAINRLNLENDLRRAIEHDEFLVYYQPIVSMFDGQVTALEALMRWQHPRRGLLLPEVFIHVAKETGLINALNKILFSQSFAQLRRWREQGLRELRLALNISARVLPEESFWRLFYSEIEAAGVPPSAIQIEVVESEMAASIDKTLAALERLKEMGVTISVDDFGTGYSSLAYLKRLPIHSLKIDRTFIKDVINDRDDAAIVAAMIVMAHVLELDVVAEGVETEGQFRFLLDQSCEKAQGYLLSHPEPADTITQLLLSGRALLPPEEEDDDEEEA